MTVPTFPPGLTTRGATLEDIPNVIALINRAELADMGEAMLELSDIEADWAGLQFDLGKNVLLVESEGRLVAYAQVAGERADADVDPDVRGQGIGSALVEWTEHSATERATGEGEVKIGQTIHENVASIAAHLQERGYERLYESWILRLPPSVNLSHRSPPANVTIRPYTPGEEQRVYRIIEDAFGEFEGRPARAFENWQISTTARSDFDPSLLMVATVDDEPVGACVGVRYPGEGWIDQLAVRRSDRGRGIAGAMLAQMYGEFRDRGEQRLGLNTDSRTGALDLYLNLGMVVEHTFTHWSIELAN